MIRLLLRVADFNAVELNTRYTIRAISVLLAQYLFGYLSARLHVCPCLRQRSYKWFSKSRHNRYDSICKLQQKYYLSLTAGIELYVHVRVYTCVHVYVHVYVYLCSMFVYICLCGMLN